LILTAVNKCTLHPKFAVIDADVRGVEAILFEKKLATISYCCSFLCPVIKTSGILPEFCFSLHLLVAMCHRKIDASVISVNRKKMRKNK